MDRFAVDDEDLFSTNDLQSYLKSGLKKQQEIIGHSKQISDTPLENEVRNAGRNSLRSSLKSSKRNQSSYNNFLVDDDDDEIDYHQGDDDDDDEENGLHIDEDSFVDSLSTFADSLVHVNQRLNAFGFPSPLVFKQRPDEHDLKTLNCIYLLLRQRQYDIEFRDDLVDRMSRLKCDNDNLAINNKRLEKQTDQALREVAVYKVKLTTTQTEHREELRKLAMEKDSWKKESMDLRTKIAQYEHLVNRHERDYSKLKEQLAKLIQSKEYNGVQRGSSARKQVEIINGDVQGVNRSGSSLMKHGKERNNDAMYQNIVGAFKDEKQELLEENEGLRQTILRFNNELNHLRNTLQRNGVESPDKKSQMNQGQLQLPYGVARAEIEKNLEEKVGEVRKMAQVATSNKRNHDLREWDELYNMVQSNNQEKAKEILEKIRRKQEDYQSVVGEQEALMKLKKAAQLSPASIRGSPVGPSPLIDDAMDDDDDRYDRRREVEEYE